MASGENPFSAMVDVIREEVRRGAGPSWDMGEVISVSPLKVRYRGVQLNADQVAAAGQWAAQLKVGDSVPVLPDREDGRFAIMQPADSAAFASAEHDHDTDYAPATHDHGCPHEIGDILITVNTTSPATRWPGTTWTQLMDRVLIGAGNLYTVGTPGGAVSHAHGLSAGYAAITLTTGYAYNPIAKIKAISPGFDATVRGSATATASSLNWGYATELGGTTDDASNMMPYEPVLFFKRTA
jgi:hypothetical protein